LCFNQSHAKTTPAKAAAMSQKPAKKTTMAMAATKDRILKNGFPRGLGNPLLPDV
jgi:hypothetical protein